MADVLRVSTERLKEVVDLTERIQSLIRRAKMRMACVRSSSPIPPRR